MDPDEHYIECDLHGKQQTTYVCQHIVQTLQDSQPRGFWSADESPENPRPDSWCNECEDLVNKTGDWNDESEAFANVKILCGACYDRAREMNRAQKKKWWQFWN